jgi:hypothetical protein
MRGQLVVCKDISGRALVRRLWDISSSGVFIHSEEEFSKRMSGQKSLEPVGFPASEVFQYDDDARIEVERTVTNWDK